MFDSVRIHIPNAQIEYDKLTKHWYSDQIIFGGKYENLRVTQKSDGAVITGSLPKFMNGNNVQAISRTYVIEAWRRIETDLHIYLTQAFVTQLEIGNTFPVSHPPREYLSTWSSFLPYKLCSWYDADSVSLSNKSRAFKGYDKGKEIAPKHLPEDFGPYALRIELQFKKGLRQYLHLPKKLSPWDLIDPEIYQLLIKTWKDFYFSKPKRRTFNPQLDGRTCSDLVDVFCCGGLQFIGREQIMGAIDSANKKHSIHRQTASRMRALIKKIEQNPRLTDSDPLTKEIDELVRNFEPEM